jgi:alpha-beta hydrolase superfamily lysophospholipase
VGGGTTGFESGLGAGSETSGKAGWAGKTHRAAGQGGTQPPAAAVQCYHGFGANTFSWALAAPAISERCGALVTAHDMPGFGLTQR